jgi:hypothetical protein
MVKIHEFDDSRVQETQHAEMLHRALDALGRRNQRQERIFPLVAVMRNEKVPERQNRDRIVMEGC